MPSAPLRPCGGGCGALVTRGRCGTCRGRDRRVDDTDRRSSQDRGYDWTWRRYRQRWLTRHPFCGDRIAGRSSEHSLCTAEGRAIDAGVVDHIVPVRGRDDPGFGDPHNHQSLCAVCHNRKTATEDGGFLRRMAGERVVVSGPPGSGKTTWVQQRARPGDIVFDLDAIAAVVTQLPQHPRPLDAMRALLAMREGLITWLERTHVNVHAFVIVTDADDGRRVAARIRARLVTKTGG